MKGKLVRTALSFFASLLVAPAFAPRAQATPTCDENSDVGQQLKLPVYRWHDNTQPVNGYIVGIHGLTFYASAFDSLAQNLSSKGFEFYAADIRGFGRWKTESAKFGGDDQIHFSQAEEDVKQICETLRSQHPGSKVYVLGESLGANLAFWLASNHSNLVDGVIVSGPCFETEVHPSPRWAVDMVRGLSHPNKPLNLTPYITPYLSNDKELTQACLNDEKICRNLSPVDLYKAGRTNKEALVNLSQIPASMPVLVIAGEQDKVMHTSAIPKQLPKIGSKQVSVHIIPQRGHLLLEHQKVDNKIATILDNFLDVRPMTANANVDSNSVKQARSASDEIASSSNVETVSNTTSASTSTSSSARTTQSTVDSEPVVQEQAQTQNGKVQTLSLGLLEE